MLVMLCYLFFFNGGCFFWRTLSEYTHSIGLAHILIRSKPALEKVSTLDFHTDTDIILY